MNYNKRFFKSVSRSFVASGIIVASLIIMSAPLLTHAETLNRQLELGMTGSDVSTLQTFLARDVRIYPQGLVTAYFGFLTKAAVSNFQSSNGIDPVGRVGPITLAAINAQMSGGVASIDNAPAINGVFVNPSRNSATVGWSTDEAAKGIVYYSTSPLVMYEYPNAPYIGGNTAMTNTAFTASQNVTLQGLQANTTYYYLVYSADKNNNSTVKWSTFQTTN